MRRPTLTHALRCALAALALVVGAAAHRARAQRPAGAALPTPDGAHAVGTTVRHLVDSTRGDLRGGTGRRSLAVQLWYPAADTGRGSARYLPDTGLLEAMRARGYAGLDSAEIGRLRGVWTHAAWNVPVRPGPALPVLVLSHGHGMSRTQYAALAAALASRGYLVAAVDHPYGGLAVHPGGRVLALPDDPADLTQDSVLARRAVEWAQDASFVLDQLARPGSALGASVGATADVARAGMVGHSFGGAAALEACRLDARFRACANLDGFPFGPVRGAGPGGPTLVLLSDPRPTDAELAARGRTRAQWTAMGRQRFADFSAVFARRPDLPAFVAEIHGTGHHSFSDAPFVAPSLLTRWGGRLLAPERAQQVVVAYLAAFFDAHLRGGSPDALTALGARSRDVTLRCYGGARPRGSRTAPPGRSACR